MDNGELQATIPSEREITIGRAAPFRLALLTSKKIIISKFLVFTRIAAGIDN